MLLMTDNAYSAENQQERPGILISGILTDYTPDSLLKGKERRYSRICMATCRNRIQGLVYSKSAKMKIISVIPCRVSYDPHEKCNDLSTLLVTSPAK